MSLNKEQVNGVIHQHLKELVNDLSNALIEERSGLAPISDEDHDNLQERAWNYTSKGIVSTTGDASYILALDTDGALIVSVQDDDETGE